MDALTTPAPDLVLIDEGPPPRRNRDRRRGLALAVVGAAALTGMVCLITLAVQAQVQTSRRAGCLENLKQLGLAFHEYHAANDQFPAPAILGRDGAPLLSWRVAILPQLGYRTLYEQFRLDEPWDSPHNLALLSAMPRLYACPGGPRRREGRTGYRVIVGPPTDPTSVNTPFEPGRGVEIREITDGTNSTLLVLETDAAVPWTRPDDLRWEPDGPLPPIASPHLGGAHGLFADGSVRFLKATISPPTLLGLLTINGGEVIGGG